MEKQTRGRGAATSTNVNQLEKQGKPGLEAQGGACLFFQNERPQEELRVRGAGSIQARKTGLDPLRNLR